MKYNKDIKQLERLIKILKDNKIKEYKNETIHLIFDSGAFISSPQKKLNPEQQFSSYYGVEYGDQVNGY